MLTSVQIFIGGSSWYNKAREKIKAKHGKEVKLSLFIDVMITFVENIIGSTIKAARTNK